jgi:hypothetical protein
VLFSGFNACVHIFVDTDSSVSLAATGCLSSTLESHFQPAAPKNSMIVSKQAPHADDGGAEGGKQAAEEPLAQIRIFIDRVRSTFEPKSAVDGS